MKIQKFSKLKEGDKFIFVDSDLFDGYVYAKLNSLRSKVRAVKLYNQFGRTDFDSDARVIKVIV